MKREVEKIFHPLPQAPLMLPVVSRLSLHVPSVGLMADLLGEHDRHLRVLESAFPEVDIVARGDRLLFSGGETGARNACKAAQEMLLLVQQGHPLQEDGVRRVISMINDDADASPSGVLGEAVTVGRGRLIRPKTVGQHRYITAIRDHTLVFGIGPAGTGKTYLAMAAAVESLLGGKARRIVLTRPAVEAGERLGFLPGDPEAKINPYLRPLYDAMYEMLDSEEVSRRLERGEIEIAPLAYMRGRTLNDAIVVLDEAQNTSAAQMKMFLTRLGFNSKMVITGDDTQVDLPADRRSGLNHAGSVLAGVPDVAVVRLSSADVVRHRIVAAIIDAYQDADHNARQGADRGARQDAERGRGKKGR